MSYILDTHYVLWSLFEPDRIDDDITAILGDENAEKLVSGISFWEISLKYSIGKLELVGTNPDEILDVVLESGLVVVPIAPELYASYYKLPKKDRHKDPFDRILIWQAIQNMSSVYQRDERISRLCVWRGVHVKVVGKKE